MQNKQLTIKITYYPMEEKYGYSFWTQDGGFISVGDVLYNSKEDARKYAEECLKCNKKI